MAESLFAVIGARPRGIEHDLRVWMVGRAVQADLLTRRDPTADRNRNQACGRGLWRTNVRREKGFEK